MKILRDEPPQNINLVTLLDVLDTLKAPGVSDEKIKSFLGRPATKWSNDMFKN